MKVKTTKMNAHLISAHEHLDIFLKTSYAERLKWLQDAQRFVHKMKDRKGISSR